MRSLLYKYLPGSSTRQKYTLLPEKRPRRDSLSRDSLTYDRSFFSFLFLPYLASFLRPLAATTGIYDVSPRSTRLPTFSGRYSDLLGIGDTFSPRRALAKFPSTNNQTNTSRDQFGARSSSLFSPQTFPVSFSGQESPVERQARQRSRRFAARRSCCYWTHGKTPKREREHAEHG